MSPVLFKPALAAWLSTESKFTESPTAEATQPLDLALRLILIDLLLRPAGPWYVRSFILLIAATGLIYPRALRSATSWAAITVLLTVRIIVDWPLPDNHIYLLAYWTMTVAISLTARDSPKYAAIGARWLLGLAFAFAILWKGLLSPEYRDGRFFTVTLLTDDRFAEAAMLLGGLTEANLEHNRKYLEPLPEGAAWFDQSLEAPRRFRILVASVTWGTLVCETALALSFLMPLATSWQILRHVLFLGFCIATYAFAPVAGFGWLLAVMGLCRCRPEQKSLRVVYVATYLLVLLYSEVP